MTKVWDMYVNYRERYFNNIEIEHDKGHLNDEEYERAYLNVLGYEDFIGNIWDTQYETSISP